MRASRAGGISFTEFSYQILQAFDYLELHRRYGCTLQTGGSDQWGNLTAGVDLIRRVTGETVHAFATPLITKADGSKYGKTAGGTLWLDPQMTSPYAFYQYFVNTDDADVGALLRDFQLPLTRARSRRSRPTSPPVHRRARRRQRWRTELTALVHGERAAAGRDRRAERSSGGGSCTSSTPTTLESALAELPRAAVRDPLPPIIDLLVACGLAESRSAARRTVSEGGCLPQQPAGERRGDCTR